MPRSGARGALASATSKLWLIPLGCLLAGAALSVATTAIDSATGFDLLPRSLTGSPSGARQILATIASSTVQLTGLVLSLSLIVIQLAMGQFSPRIVRSLLNDRRSQWAVGILVARAFGLCQGKGVPIELIRPATASTSSPTRTTGTAPPRPFHDHIALQEVPQAKPGSRQLALTSNTFITSSP